MSVNSQEYRNQIVDFHETKEIDYLDVASEKNKKVEKCLHDLIDTLHTDLTETQKERDNRNIIRINREHEKIVKDALKSQSGISSLFDKGKQIVLEEIKNGTIEEKDKEKIIKSLRTYILQMSFENTVKNIQDSGDIVEFKPTEREFGNLAAKVLKNEKIIKKISDSITKTIKGHGKAQTKNIINLLTNNRYKEIAIKVQKLDVKRVGQIIQNNKKNGVFSKLKKLKKNVFGKMKNPRTLLKFFKVKRVKLNKKGFLGLYNDFVYKELIKRVEEFNEQEISKPKMAKALMKSLMKFGALKALGVLKTVGGFIRNSLKSMVKSIWNITKSIGKMGMSFLSTIKTMIFTPTGQWIVGFVAGVVWRALIKPIVDRIQPIIDTVMTPIKKWLGIEGEFTIAEAKNSFAMKVVDFERKLNSPDLIRKLESIEPIEHALTKLQFNFSKLEYFVKAGGWKKSVGAAAAGKVGNAGAILGTLIGLAFGPLGAVVGGAIGGAIGGIVGTFVKRYYDALSPTSIEGAEKSRIFADMRKQWEKRPVTKRSKKLQKAMFKMSQMKEDKTKQKKQKEDELKKEMSKTGKDRDEQKIRKLQEEIDSLDGELKNIGEMNEIASGGYTEEQNRICTQIIERLKDDDNYFNLNKGNFDTVDWFWEQAQNGKFVGNKAESQREKLLSFMKKNSMLMAIQDFYDNTISFSKIKDQANEYLRGMVNKGIYLGFKNTYGNDATQIVLERDKNGNIIRDQNGRQKFVSKELTMRGWFTDESLGGTVQNTSFENVSFDEEYYKRGLVSTYNQRAEGQAERIWNGLSKEQQEILGDKEMIVRLLAPIIEIEDPDAYTRNYENVKTYITTLCDNALMVKDVEDGDETVEIKGEGVVSKTVNGLRKLKAEMLKKMLDDKDITEKTKIEIQKVLNDVERQHTLREGQTKEEGESQKNKELLTEIENDNAKTQKEINEIQDKIDDINRNKDILLKGKIKRFVSSQGETFLVPVHEGKKGSTSDKWQTIIVPISEDNEDDTSASESKLEEKTREMVNPFTSKYGW